MKNEDKTWRKYHQNVFLPKVFFYKLFKLKVIISDIMKNEDKLGENISKTFLPKIFFYEHFKLKDKISTNRQIVNNEISLHCGVGEFGQLTGALRCYWREGHSHSGNSFLIFYKVKIHLLSDPAISLFFYPREMQTKPTKSND